MKKRTEIMYYVLLVSCVLYIAAGVWSDLRKIEYPIISYGEEKVVNERGALNIPGALYYNYNLKLWYILGADGFKMYVAYVNPVIYEYYMELLNEGG